MVILTTATSTRTTRRRAPLRYEANQLADLGKMPDYFLVEDLNLSFGDEPEHYNEPANSAPLIRDP